MTAARMLTGPRPVIASTAVLCAPGCHAIRFTRFFMSYMLLIVKELHRMRALPGVFSALQHS